MVASTSSELPAGCQALEGSTAAVAAPSLPHHAPTTDLYNRFSAKKKTYILASLSLAGVLGPFASSSFLPSIPSMSKDLGVSASVLNITVAVFLVVIAAGPLPWSSYAAFYGRRPILIASLSIFSVGSIGVACSQSLSSLLGTRIVQGFGASASLSIGAGAIGDCFDKTSRGAALSAFYGCVLLAPALSPSIAGVIDQYTALGWRAVQWLLVALGAVATALAIALPETAQTRGIDVYQQRLDGNEFKVEAEEKKDASASPTWRSRFAFPLLNPLRPLYLLRNVNLLFVTLYSSFTLMTSFALLVPLTSTIGPRYQINNPALLGCFYLVAGAGNLVGSRFAGRLADSTLKRALARGGCAEDRLKATLVAGGVVVPCSAIVVGWLLEKGSGAGGLAGVCIALFLNGLGVIFVLAPSNTYCVDVQQSRSTEAMAANNCLRYLFSAASSAFVLPLIHRIGVGWTNTLMACLCWIGFALILLTIRYGPIMRCEESSRSEAASETPSGKREKIEV